MQICSGKRRSSCRTGSAEKRKSPSEAGARSIKKGGCLLRDRIGERYQFIDTEKKTYPISLMCDVLDVCRSGYYGWKNREKSSRQREYDSLIPIVREAHRLSNGTYGARRIADEIVAHGTPCGRTKAATIMNMLMLSPGKRGNSKLPLTASTIYRLH